MIRHLLFAIAVSFAGMAHGQSLATATFSLGCFWCGEEAFEKVPGVVTVTSGYTGGTVEHPTYQQVSSGTTGHVEAVEVKFDPAKVSYAQLLDVFWINHDPTKLDRQFCDQGSPYRPGIYWHDAAQKQQAEASMAKYDKLKTFKEPLLTPIVEAGVFWPAEDYHQDYYKKNPIRYKFYSTTCGRYARLDELWGELRK